MVQLTDNHFELFGLAPGFALDRGQLDAAYRAVQAQVHPDRFAAADDAQRRRAMQWAAQANEAYRTLRDPVARAAYLCGLHGVELETESNTAMPAEFLVQQLEWREALDDADGDVAALTALADEVAALRRQRLAELGDCLDVDRDFAHAAGLVRQLLFVDRFAESIDEAVARADG